MLLFNIIASSHINIAIQIDIIKQNHYYFLFHFGIGLKTPDSEVTLLTDEQSNTGTISGIISEQSTSNPVAFAGVALYSVTGTAPNEVETVIATTRTNVSGRYLFANVTPGMYRVKSTKQEVVV